jgi:transcriptional regulator with XRE-family HTH domain
LSSGAQADLHGRAKSTAAPFALTPVRIPLRVRDGELAKLAIDRRIGRLNIFSDTKKRGEAVSQKEVHAPSKGDVQGPLGTRLRERRQELGLTLQEVADRAGLSVGFISQIERGITTPSLTSLIGVSRVLAMHVSDFLAQPSGAAPLTRRAERPHYALGGAALTYERLSANFPGNVLRCVIIHEPPGYRSEPIAHEGEEIFFILEGVLTVEVEGERTILEVGDSIHFQSTKIHSTWNHATSTATILHTCTMDVFGDEPRERHTHDDLKATRSVGRKRAARISKTGGGKR